METLLVGLNFSWCLIYLLLGDCCFFLVWFKSVFCLFRLCKAAQFDPSTKESCVLVPASHNLPDLVQTFISSFQT